MAKEPLVIPAHPDQRDLPPRQRAIFIVGDQQYQLAVAFNWTEPSGVPITMSAGFAQVRGSRLPDR